MKPLILMLLVTLMGCQSETELVPVLNQDRTELVYRTELAYLHDTSQLADGCDPYVAIDTGNPSTFGTRYKPTPASLPIFQKAFKDRVGTQPYSRRVAVKVRFAETSRQVVIHCGWVSPTVTEIVISEITDR